MNYSVTHEKVLRELEVYRIQQILRRGKVRCRVPGTTKECVNLEQTYRILSKKE